MAARLCVVLRRHGSTSDLYTLSIPRTRIASSHTTIPLFGTTQFIVFVSTSRFDQSSIAVSRTQSARYS